ncbi:hypothetical protein [Gordonia soli]|uniref:ATP-grasp domain-containing protein n=1 Tax=Gordonia soli NBRC 108243 TaxID=1223545 RepID=M0QG18_9ACTN|nr:hypothetical protein [Gordonia soli]GAC67523.1 hypothetical protein GS4_08_01080 [Gordonia soli NBRC 108243]
MSRLDRHHVLITFGRSFLTLDLARQLSAAGHRVTLVDSIPIGVGRLSRATSAFYKVPPPKFQPRAYARELARIVREQNIDLVIPIHEETDILAMMVDEFPDSCKLFLSDFETENRLHNKFEFSELLTERGIPSLKYSRVAGPADLAKLDFSAPFAMKEVYSRGSQKVHKVTPGDDLGWLTFDEGNPWLAQEWVGGDKYCSYSVCHEGRIYAHATYPVRYAIGGSSCLTFQSVQHQGILDWVTDFVKDQNFTGQVGFDFIEDPERGLFCIECNPRATSGIMMFRPEDGIDRAFFAENDEIIEPDPDTDRMIGVGMMLYGWRRSAVPDRSLSRFAQLRAFAREFRAADDVITHKGDQKPAWLLPVAYAGILRSCVRYRVGLAEGFMHDHEWDGTRI